MYSLCFSIVVWWISSRGLFLPSTVQNSFFVKHQFFILLWNNQLTNCVLTILNLGSEGILHMASLVSADGTAISPPTPQSFLLGCFSLCLSSVLNWLTSVPWLTNQSFTIWPPFFAPAPLLFQMLYFRANADSNSKLSNPASFSRLPLCFLSFLFPSLTWSMYKSCRSLAACLSLKTGGHPISFSTCIGLAITHSDILALMYLSNFLPSLPLFFCFPQLTTVPFFKVSKRW